ncbi:MAG: class I SAM-dependent methyltransferase [Pseudomonadota bacterium]
MPETFFPASLTGESFQASDVVEHYIHRPPYAAQIFKSIVEHAPATDRLLDLGCGEGKVARPLASVFQEVVAVDPSQNMIALGQSLAGGDQPNIQWIAATAEEAPLSGRFDVVTFASSIHWMDPEVLFGKLRDHLTKDHILAIISGDTPHDPPWEQGWQQLLENWVPIATGRPYGSQEWRNSRDKHLTYLNEIQSYEFQSEPFRQSIDDYIACQHSRDTFAVPRLGERLAEFRKDVKHLLEPSADRNGVVEFRVKTNLTISTLRER